MNAHACYSYFDEKWDSYLAVLKQREARVPDPGLAKRNLAFANGYSCAIEKIFSIISVFNNI